MSNNDRFTYHFGLGHVGSYQTSAKPFLSSSISIPDETQPPVQISFPNVTRFIVVTNTIDPTDPPRPLRFGFSEYGTQGLQDNNYIVLDNGETFEAEFRVSSVFLVSNGSYETSGSIVAGLTGISSKHLVNNWSGSVGVG